IQSGRRCSLGTPLFRRAFAVSEDRFRSVLENSPYGIYRVTLDGRFLTANPALCAMLGYAPDELFATNISAFYPDAAERQRLIADYEVRPHGASVDVPWKRKDGRTITTRVWVYASRDSSGRIEFFDGYVEDITGVRETEQALRQAEKLAALGELVSGVAHELNNPLSAMLLFAEDLLSNEHRPDEREALSIIAQQARRSRAIVRDLLSFVRNRDAVREPVESEPFFAQLTKTLLPQLVELGVSLHSDIVAQATVLPIDRTGIEQVVTNLVINAAQAAGRGGNVWLNAKRDGQHFVIDVIDDGGGIPDDVLPRIFEPFFTTKPMGQGTGLGLSVSRGVVQQHGGWIEARNRESENGPRPGAHFTVKIPLPSQTIVVLDRTAEGATSTQAEGLRRVLIVDDEETIRRALTRFYQRRGWVVTQAEDGSRAFERLIRGLEPYDLVISDMKMPGFSGIELHAALSEMRPDMLDRILFCTGEVDSAAVSTFVADTNSRVLLKPFDLRTLASLSDDIVARRTPKLPQITS
ncbi:MAG: hybrid sensor histidine kinase/response regulator, partial [bacterium]